MAVSLDRIKGALYGVAVGDALGGPVEFLPRAEVRRRYPDGLQEMVGGGWLHLLPGETTDDTAMTFCVAEGINAAEYSNPLPLALEVDLAREIGYRFIRWLHTNPPDVGNTCREAIQRAEQNLRAMSALDAWHAAAASLGEEQDGNGALMRCVFPGLFYPSEQQACDVAQYQAYLTHSGHQSACICGAYARLIHAYVVADYERGWYAMQSLLYWLDFTEDDLTAPSEDWSPSGYVVETMRAVLLAERECSFEKALIKAVNFGGDADTVGAIVGGLAGAEYGFSAIPERWVHALSPAVRYKLDAAARCAYKRRTKRL